MQHSLLSLLDLRNTMSLLLHKAGVYAMHVQAQDHTAAAAAGDGQQQPPPQQQQRQQQQPLAEDEPIGLAGMPAKPLEERPAS